jgi:hypothetical protein
VPARARSRRACTETEDFLPVIGDLVEGIEVEAGIALGAGDGGADGIEVRLRGRAGQRGHGEVDDVDAGLAAASTEAALRPEVSWVWKWIGMPISCFSASRGRRRPGFAEAGHVLDREDVGAHRFDFLGLGDVVFQRILVALRLRMSPV